jgi:hypothetical protein
MTDDIKFGGSNLDPAGICVLPLQKDIYNWHHLWKIIINVSFSFLFHHKETSSQGQTLL